MNAIIVLVLCVTALGTVGCTNTSPGIGLGRDALPGDVPWIVSLSSELSNGKHFCGGSILDSTHILTSSICVSYNGTKIYKLKARIGSLDLDKGGLQYDVVNVSQLALADEYKFMVILTTDKVMVLDSTLPVPTGKVTLPPGNTDLAPGTMVRVAGWDINTSEGMTFTEKLQVMDIPIVSHEDCDSVYNEYIPDYITCAGAQEDGSCVGDAGGPLTLGGVQYGVTLAGCTLAPGLFIDVDYFIDEFNTNK